MFFDRSDRTCMMLMPESTRCDTQGELTHRGGDRKFKSRVLLDLEQVLIALLRREPAERRAFCICPRRRAAPPRARSHGAGLREIRMDKKNPQFCQGWSAAQKSIEYSQSPRILSAVARDTTCNVDVLNVSESGFKACAAASHVPATAKRGFYRGNCKHLSALREAQPEDSGQDGVPPGDWWRSICRRARPALAGIAMPDARLELATR